MTEAILNMNDFLSRFYGDAVDVNKADAPILSSTTGVFNAVYGAYAFSQFSNEANVLAAIPKYPWQKSGWRVETADAGTVGSEGIAESGTVPESRKPTYAEIEASVKQVATTFELSFIQQGLARTGDDAYGDMQVLRERHAVRHAKGINKQLLVDTDTLAGNNFESIDRVTISEDAAVALSYTAGDANIYGLDRGSASWSDAVVSHNSGTDRTFDLKYVRDTLATLENNGARTNLIITGSDTKWRIIEQAETHVRYNGVVKQNEMIQVGINGVQTDEGINHGVRVATVYNIPMFVSQHVVKDTISRIYLLDTTTDSETGIPRLGLALLYPTLYFESGMDATNRDPFSIDFFGTKGGYYTAGELICTYFKAQGSIRDLK